MFPKVPVKKQIKERVDTTVDGGDHLCDLDTCVQIVAVLFILQGQVFLESGQEKCNVIERPHQKEDAHYDKSKTPTMTKASLFLELRGLFICIQQNIKIISGKTSTKMFVFKVRTCFQKGSSIGRK